MSIANLGGGDIGSTTRTLCHPGVTGNFLSSGVVPTKDPSINPLMGWETSSDTLEEIILKFPTKEKAIEYAEKNNISFKIIEPKKKRFVIKSYADNFIKN